MSYPINPANAYPTCIITGLASIPLTYMVFRSINQTCIDSAKNRFKNGKTIPICSIVSLSSFTLMVTITFIIFLTAIIQNEFTEIAVILISASWLFYAIGLMVMMFIYVLRLDSKTFKNSNDTLSILSYPKWLINVLYIFLSTIVLLCIMIVILRSVSGNTTLSLSVALIALILYVIFSITLVILFFKKLFLIMTQRLESNMVKEDANNSNADTDNKGKEHGFVIELITMKSMMKYCLLVLQGIISTYIGNILAVIAMHPDTPSMPGYAFVGIDSLVNCVSLYFMFSFNNDQYTKWCLKCHKCCEQLCISWIFSKYKDKLSLEDRAQYETLILQ